MRINMRTLLPTLALTLAATLSACSSMDKVMSNSLQLTGDQEVQPVSTAAVGSGAFTVASDGSVSGSVKTQGVAGLMAHIHMGAAGKNGPVIVPLTKTADGVWSVPAGAKLKDDQLAAYKMGGLYVNVHSAEHKGGEIRAQLKP